MGLAPLEVDTGPVIRESENEPDEKIVVEDGVEIHHKAAKSLTGTRNLISVIENATFVNNYAMLKSYNTLLSLE